MSFFTKIRCYDEIDNSLDDTLLELGRNECLSCFNFDDIKNTLRMLKLKITGTQNFQNLHFNFMHMFIKKIISFPRERFYHQTLTTNGFFETINKIIKVKIHLHPSHVTGKIYGYAHNFVT